MPHIALRASPTLSAGQRRAGHDHGEKCGLGKRAPVAQPAGLVPRLPGAHRVLPPFPGDATSRFQAPDGSAMGRFGCRQP